MPIIKQRMSSASIWINQGLCKAASRATVVCMRYLGQAWGGCGEGAGGVGGGGGGSCQRLWSFIHFIWLCIKDHPSAEKRCQKEQERTWVREKKQYYSYTQKQTRTHFDWTWWSQWWDAVLSCSSCLSAYQREQREGNIQDTPQRNYFHSCASLMKVWGKTTPVPNPTTSISVHSSPQTTAGSDPRNSQPHNTPTQEFSVMHYL